MTYIIQTLHGPRGRQTGYAVQTIAGGTIIARFHNRDYVSWRAAKDAATRLISLLED